MTEIIESEEYKTLFPNLEGDAFDELVKDIDTNGQAESIILNQDGVLIDGYQRKRACEQLGIDVKSEVVEFKGKEHELAFIMSHNLHRRHLTTIQKYEIAKKMLLVVEEEIEDGAKSPPAPAGNHDKPSIAKTAKIVGIGKTAIKQASAIEEGRPDLYEKVKRGELTIDGAHKRMTKPMMFGKGSKGSLVFQMYHVDPILKGVKTQTSRQREPQYEVGDKIDVKVKSVLRIKKVEEKKLGDFTDEDYEREGGYTKEEFIAVWTQINGSYKPNMSVYVTTFEYEGVKE